MTTYPSQERLIRKEVLLGLIRERTFPQEHIGLRLLAPFMDVTSDDVFFEYSQGFATGMVPARAEDAEAEMAQAEDTFGEGRATIVDWAFKNHYKPSDVSKYQDVAYLRAQIGANLPRSVATVTEAFDARVARDTIRRRKMIDNRLEALIMNAHWEGSISYNNGKVIFDYDFGRPAGQSDGGAPSTPSTSGPSVTAWDDADADPIDNALDVKQFIRDTYGVSIDKMIASEKVIRQIVTSAKFAARTGLAIPGSSTATPTPVDPRYLIDGWGDGISAAAAIFSRATGISVIPYDATWQSRTPGSTTLSLHRFSPDDRVLFLPSSTSVSELDDSIGWGKTFSSPHPEGNWTSGYYEWQKDTGPDPWGYDFGNGIKAMPVFPHMDLSYVLQVLA